MAAGTYNYKLQRLTYTPATNGSTNQDVPGWTASGVWYWCSVDELSGRRGTNYGATLTGADVDIRVRNWPDLAAQDILSDGTLYYQIDSLVYGDDEWVCDAHRFDAAELEG